MDLPCVNITDEHLNWDPGSTRFKNQEEALTSSYGYIIGKNLYDQSFAINAVGSSMIIPLADISHGNNLGSVLESKVGVSAITGVTSIKQGKEVNMPTPSKQWMIPQDRALNTIRKTTRHGA